MVTYLDCASTTPIDPRVLDAVMGVLQSDLANAGSRTHAFGARARQAVEAARDQVAAAARCGRGDVIFTSGATEANNLAILGLAEHGIATGRRHLVSTAIEHHAVLEPLQALAARGFSLTLVAPTAKGCVEADEVLAAMRDDTLLVSVMHANNETGIVQPVDRIADAMADHPAFLHVDAAQTFGRELPALHHSRVDLMSLSGHKFHAPQGIGALITRRRKINRPPVAPILFGGGQERGLRPGTLPVHLIVGLGLAAELASCEAGGRATRCQQIRDHLISALHGVDILWTGDPALSLPHIANFAIRDIDADDVIEALADWVAVSRGSACTSQSQTCSHVLSAMGASVTQSDGAMRWSWSHLTPEPDWRQITSVLQTFAQRTTAPIRL